MLGGQVALASDFSEGSAFSRSVWPFEVARLDFTTDSWSFICTSKTKSDVIAMRIRKTPLAKHSQSGAYQSRSQLSVLYISPENFQFSFGNY